MVAAIALTIYSMGIYLRRYGPLMRQPALAAGPDRPTGS
jgi:hypothetical protein